MSDENQAELDNDSELLELSDEELMGMASPPEVNSEELEEDDYEEEDENTLDEDEDDEEDDSDYEEDESSNSAFDNDGQSDDNELTIKEKASNEETSDSDVDYESAYKEIFKPFKANGKEIQVRNVDEAIQLMQMGANYNKKMSGIKDQLPFLKMLERNDLLDENKLSYAIDLLNGDKAAIAKLIQDSEIDLYDIDEESAEEYSPSYKGISDVEMELSNTIDELKDSPAYERTLEVATQIWDNASQQFIVNNPSVLRLLENHISAGIFDKVWDEVERQQSFGKLEGLNSLEAYKVVGDALNEQGVFGNAPTKGNVAESKQAKRAATNRKKQATQKPKTTSRSKNSNINPLSLSDEEFMKIGNENLM